MGYVGNKPALNYTTFAVQHFTTSATTGYTLDNAVTNENGIALFINNVRQEPGSSYAYTASGTTLTLSAATTTSDTMYCVFIGKAVQTVNPPVGSVDSAQLATDAVTTVKILDTAVTGAKLNDDSISAQSALGAAPADTDEFLVSDAGVLKRVDYSYIKGITQSSFVPTAAPLIINGNMAVAQRGTSFASIGDGEYTLDRFETNKTMDAVATITQETLTSGNAYADGFKNAFKVDVTTADASLTGTQRLLIQYGIEGQDLQVLKFGTANAEKLTLSFWIKATKTGTNIVRLYAPDDNRAVSASYTVDSTDTWEKKVLNFPADTTGVIDNNNGAGIQIAWAIGAGPDFQSGTLATTWGTQTAANDFVGQVNNLDSTSNNWHLTGVQLEVGEYTSSDLPPFRHESYGDNLQRCQRYFQTIADGSWSSNETISNGFWQSSSAFFFTLRLAVEMRANPSLTTTMGTNYINIHIGGGSDAGDNIATYSGSTKRAFGLNAAANSSGTQGEGGQIMLNNASAFVAGDAEL